MIRRWRRMARRVGRWSGFLAPLALFAAWWVALAPTSLGGSVEYVVIRGDSMLPTFEGGDLVIVRTTGAYAAGDIVAYRVPAGELGEGRIVIHRIVCGDASAFVVQGDNNPAPDPWRPARADIAGTAWLRIPALGRVLAILHQPAIAASIAAAVAVGVLVLRWSRRDEQSRKTAGGSIAVPSAVRRAP
jgi:signal peptidase I